MTDSRQTLEQIYEILDKNTPQRIVFIEADEKWQFLFLVVLSAQTTDRQVMSVKDSLFARFPSLQDFADADVKEIEQSIRSIGFFRNKAANLKKLACVLVKEYGGNVPSEIDELVKLPGVGRKTANCVLGEKFGKPAIIVDTHFLRCSNRLGFVHTDSPLETEGFYRDNLQEDKWYRYSMSLNYFGRSICRAKNPQCSMCYLKSFCEDEK